MDHLFLDLETTISNYAMTILLIFKKSLFKRDNEKTQNNTNLKKIWKKHNKTPQIFCIQRQISFPYHLFTTSSMIMGVFMFRDVQSSAHLDDSSMKVVNIAHVFLRPQDCQSFQLFLFLKSAYLWWFSKTRFVGERKGKQLLSFCD